eukprot:TRINITY_DN2322_c0_g1_i1.p1 TRINITY_DN2322_c0_g1~~TRINITY_DN2322_c0_g1_i1.p1  ORF type:complete len:915 (+),score=124.85 TRINITY_DN2322_c0_g1_i1:50-2746(+)
MPVPVGTCLRSPGGPERPFDGVGELTVERTLQLRPTSRVELMRSGGGDRYVRKILQLDQRADDDAEQTQLREMQLLTTLQHPNIVRLLHAEVRVAAQVPSFFIAAEDSRELVMVMEFAAGGDLAARLAISKEKVPPVTAFRWVRQLASALACLQQHEIVHRDVKTANIFLTTVDMTAADVLLGDFGVGRIVPCDQSAKTQVGTPQYMAPEMWEGKQYGHAIDVWSLGVVAFEICCGHSPWQATNFPQLVMEITGSAPMRAKRELARMQVGTELAGVVQAMLSSDPARRPTAAGILKVLSDMDPEHSSRKRRGGVRLASSSPLTKSLSRLVESTPPRVGPKRQRTADIRSRSAPCLCTGDDDDDDEDARHASTVRPSRKRQPPLEFVLTPIQKRLFGDDEPKEASERPSRQRRSRVRRPAPAVVTPPQPRAVPCPLPPRRLEMSDTSAEVLSPRSCHSDTAAPLSEPTVTVSPITATPQASRSSEALPKPEKLTVPDRCAAAAAASLASTAALVSVALVEGPPQPATPARNLPPCTPRPRASPSPALSHSSGDVLTSPKSRRTPSKSSSASQRKAAVRPPTPPRAFAEAAAQRTPDGGRSATPGAPEQPFEQSTPDRRLAPALVRETPQTVGNATSRCGSVATATQTDDLPAAPTTPASALCEGAAPLTPARCDAPAAHPPATPASARCNAPATPASARCDAPTTPASARCDSAREPTRDRVGAGPRLVWQQVPLPLPRPASASPLAFRRSSETNHTKKREQSRKSGGTVHRTLSAMRQRPAADAQQATTRERVSRGSAIRRVSPSPVRRTQSGVSPTRVSNPVRAASPCRRSKGRTSAAAAPPRSAEQVQRHRVRASATPPVPQRCAPPPSVGIGSKPREQVPQRKKRTNVLRRRAVC